MRTADAEKKYQIYQIYQHQLRRCSHCEPQSSTRHNSIGLNVKAIKVMVALVWASTCVLNLFEALLFDALLVVWSAAVTLYRRSAWKAIDLLECKLSTPTNSSLAPGLRHWQEPRKSSRSQRPRVETSIYFYVYIIWYQLISYWFILTSHYSLMLDSILSCHVFTSFPMFFHGTISSSPDSPWLKRQAAHPFKGARNLPAAEEAELQSQGRSPCGQRGRKCPEEWSAEGAWLICDALK